MKRLRIGIADLGPGCYDMLDRFMDWVAERHEVEIVPRDADYVIHSCNGFDVLKHKGVRIFLTGEAVCPDFNVSDYAFGFERMEFGDRHCRLPLFRLQKTKYALALKPRPPPAEILRAKTGFCAVVVSNAKGAVERGQIVEALEPYKHVESGGRWRNNVGGAVPDKLAFQSRCKFAIAFENASMPGYVTEKILDAFVSHAIPIYWGDPEVTRDFNPEAFVNCHDFPSMAAVVERVKEIDRDDALYSRMISAPCFRDGVEPEKLREEYFRGFLENIFGQPQEQVFRRNRGFWGRKHERRMFEAFHRPLVQLFRCMQSWNRRRRHPPYVRRQEGSR